MVERMTEAMLRIVVITMLRNEETRGIIQEARGPKPPALTDGPKPGAKGLSGPR